MMSGMDAFLILAGFALVILAFGVTSRLMGPADNPLDHLDPGPQWPWPVRGMIVGSEDRAEPPAGSDRE